MISAMDIHPYVDWVIILDKKGFDYREQRIPTI